MRAREVREYQPGATWRTQEEEPRYMRVLGKVAIDDTMLLVEMDSGERLWLQRASCRVYRRGSCIAVAECVGLGEERQINHEHTEFAGGRSPL